MLFKESIKILDADYSFETGKWAKQANGSVVLKWKNIVLLGNATASKYAKEDIDFFPLTVDYREKFYSCGQFAGGFFKREGRPTNVEVLTSRLTDRPIRPLFPKNFLNELQIFITLLSADEDQTSQVHSITCASAALMASNIPFDGPVAGVRIGRIAEKFILFPTQSEQKISDLNLLLAGTSKAVTMIEGSANQLSKEVMLDAVKFGHEEIKKICALQEKLRDTVKKSFLNIPEVEENESLKKEIYEMAHEKMLKANESGDKKLRQENIDSLCEEVLSTLEEKYNKEGIDEKQIKKDIKEASIFLEKMEVDIVRSQIFNKGIRADGRKLDEVRSIDIEFGVLPSTHGSALFTRGETQSLGVVTLGTENNAQIIDNVDGDYKEYFYLHYNFLPYSVGEVRRYMGPGRREIGHGKLAENALRPLIPLVDDFPYVIRVVSEILESNGSSSMATVCSACIALMEAGVPIQNAVAGIAMGLITDENGKYAILSDIAGLEDHFGDMDFKVAATNEGITAFQLDTKVQGISYEIMEKALEQAEKGILHILDKMNEKIDKPREKISKLAPGVITFKIDKSNIGELIGPGGSNIRSIIEKTNAEVIVKDDGTVNVYGKEQSFAEEAQEIIKLQFKEAKVDEIYEGKVQKITEYGAFVEILPGKSGLCHISKVSDEHVRDLEDILKVGQTVKVKVVAIDRQGRLNLSIKDAVE